MVRELEATFFGGEEVQEIFHSRGFRYTRELSQVFSDYVAYAKTYVQTEGLAMGAPTSSIFSELYLQSLENSTIYNLLLNYDIKGYFRYVDDILIIYDEGKTNIDTLLECFKNISPKLKFIIEKEIEHKINFLDITVNREPNKMSIDIYRKPT